MPLRIFLYHPSITSTLPFWGGCTKESHHTIIPNLHRDKIHFSVALYCLTVEAFQMQMQMLMTLGAPLEVTKQKQLSFRAGSRQQ